METSSSAEHHRRLPGFEGELSRFVEAALMGCLAQLHGAGEAPETPLARGCRQGLERLWTRRRALVRTLSRPARPRAATVEPRRSADPSTIELDIATARAAWALIEAAGPEGRGEQAGAAWPPAPARCAAALRWAVEQASSDHAVRRELMRLGTGVLPRQFAGPRMRPNEPGADADQPAPGGEAAAAGEQPAPTEARADLIDGAHPGRWFRMVLLAQWADARVTWRSANGRFFMFHSQLAGRSHSLSRDALERLIERGEFKPLGRTRPASTRSGSERS